MRTTTPPISAPGWLLLDASEKTIGDVASVCAHLLRGKHKVTFASHQACGDHVVVINLEKLEIPPAKPRRKTYVRHTGYLGHLSQIPLARALIKYGPAWAVERAVKGMLPRNRLRPIMLKRLHLFMGSDHRYSAQKPRPFQSHDS